eukprot:m.387379 g.387379  ORF g.387379 m.387379 type:complete len:204 (+) comp20066_c2_seq4:47-658(+)
MCACVSTYECQFFCPRANRNPHRSNVSRHFFQPTSKGSGARNCFQADGDEQQTEVMYFDAMQPYYAAPTLRRGTVVDECADDASQFAHQALASCFGVLRIFLDIVLALVLETLKLLAHVVAKLTVGMLDAFGGLVLKPVLNAMFNNMLHPTLVFVLNILTAVKVALMPLVEWVRLWTDMVANMLRAFRLVTVDRQPKAETHHV